MPDTLTNLMTISLPHLVERYRRAMAGFGLKMPELDSFEIDLIGYSPQIAEALGDRDYMDPKKVNRRFIILSPEQEHLTLLHPSFSNTRDLMLGFFEKNRRVIYALTIKDVVFGEIEDNVYEIDDIEDLLSIEQIAFKIGTHENLTDKTAQLKLLIDRLMKEPEAWRDTPMLEEMVELAKQTGDIRENKMLPEEVVFRQETFWASHFGGTYVFRDGDQITVICDPSARGFRRSRPWQVGYLDINDKETVFDFLYDSGRLQPPLGSWIERSRLLELRRNMAAAWLAHQQNDELPPSFLNESWVRRWERDNHRLVSEDNVLPLIDWAVEEVEEWQNIDIDEVEEDLRFVLCRADPDHPDMRLTNRLISHYLPFDFLSRFEFNRPLFSEHKDAWSPDYREYVASSLIDTYIKDRSRLYPALYELEN